MLKDNGKLEAKIKQDIQFPLEGFAGNVVFVLQVVVRISSEGEQDNNKYVYCVCE